MSDMSVTTKTILTLLLIAAFSFFIYNSITSHAGQCSELKEQLQTEISGASSCNSDSDCKSYTFDCAFGCSNVVAVNQIERLNLLAQEYARMCHHFCPDCPTETKVALCVKGQCQSKE